MSELTEISQHTDLAKLTRQIAKAESDLIEIRTGDIDDQEDGMAVLFTGQWHDSFPRQLVLNQTLSPLEKITWQVIRLSIDSPSKPGSTPRREELAAMINCSAATVTTARTLLRACRWITFCKTVRKQGRFVGDIYLLHDQPLSLESTLSIDTTYIQFLQQQTQTSSKRLRGIAGNLLKEIDSLQSLVIPNELDVIANRLQQTMEIDENHHIKIFSMVVRDNHDGISSPINNKTRNGAHHSKKLSLGESLESTDIVDHNKNFALVQSEEDTSLTGARNFFPPRARGSNNNFINNKYIHGAQARDYELKVANTKNTKKADDPNPNPKGDPEKTFTLAIQHFPLLASNAIKKYVILTFGNKEYQLPVIQRMLSKLPEANRDDVLLQYVGRRAASYHGWAKASLHNPIAFVGELIRRDKAGDFFPDEWALELKKSIATHKEPEFWDSPEFYRMSQLFADEDVRGGAGSN
jgi:hypothetical protein